MHCQQLLIAYLSATVAALPSPLKGRQSSGISGLGGLLGGSGTLPIPSSLPTGLFGGLGGLGSGGLGSTSGSGTSGLGGLLGGSGTGSTPPALPTGLFGGLGGLGSGGLGSTSGSGTSGLGGLLGGSGTGSTPPALPTGLLGGLSGSGLGGLGSGLSSRSTASGLDTEASADDACQNVTLIFARGTTELGTLGSIVGPGLSTDIKKDLNNNVVVQGVSYAADVTGIFEEIGNAGPGTKAMVADVQAALSKCPSTQIVLSGYSQGAMLVHNTMSTLTATQAASVKVAITFGDPFVGQAPKSIPKENFKSYCATADPVCAAGVAMSPSAGGTASASAASHLGYGADVAAAATFIKGKVTV